MIDRTQSHDERTDIRTLDRHHGHREVYRLLDAVEGHDHEADGRRDDGKFLTEVVA